MPDSDREPADTTHRSRRTVVQGIGVTVAAGAAGYFGFAAAGPELTQPVAGGSGYGDPGAVALAAVSDIPADGGLVLPDARVVLVRSGDSVKCFSAVCTHQGCLVSGVSNGAISCPCHGSVFDADTGAVLEGPASAPLAEIAVVVSGDSVVRA